MSEPYLNQILAREAVDTSIFSPLWSVQQLVAPSVERWAGQHLLGISPSGSFAKGTANKSGTDIDLFISVHEDVPNTLAEIFQTLFNRMRDDGYAPRKQNVSIGVTIAGMKVDLVPGKRQSAYTTDHSLFRSKAGTWTKTNVITHVNHVLAAGRQRETRILKLWRNQKSLDFPSFYLELTVIAALSRSGVLNSLSDNVKLCLVYIRDNLSRARLVDPANTRNIISDDLSTGAKTMIERAAATALGGAWDQFVK
jgi:hypothetical protein